MARPRPAFVRLHPADDPSKLHPVFFGHPDEFVPQPDPNTGRIQRWGLVTDTPDGEDEDDGHAAHMAFLERLMKSQSLYGYMGGLKLKKPEEQFVDALIARKEKTLKAGKAAAAPFYKRDYIVDIDLALYERDFRTQPRVWRRIRVSGGISLAALQDKVLGPAMGWTRNYHGSIWCDHRDGALLGDPECGAIDMMHVHMHYYGFVDQAPWHLGDLLQAEGQTLGWTYDIGDQWRHVLTLVQILPEEESTGRVQVMDGAMACPPEDSKGLDDMGPRSYQEFLDEWADPAWRTSSDCREALAEASTAMNYRDSRRGQQIRSQPEFGGSFLQETVATGKDARAVALCAACGSPHHLQQCSGCKLVRYCSKECQKVAWSSHKAECKAAQARRVAGSSSGSR